MIKLIIVLFLIGGILGCVAWEKKTEEEKAAIIGQAQETALGILSHIPGGEIISDIVLLAALIFGSKKTYNSLVNAPPGKLFGSPMSPALKRLIDENGYSKEKNIGKS